MAREASVGEQYQGIHGEVGKEEMINIASCDFATFQTQMVAKFGQQAFTQGFQLIKSN